MEQPRAATRPWPLPGLDGAPWQRALGIVLLIAVAATRLLLFPDGPWEQDEAIFASGVVDFDLRRHRPHPPAFPGWIALGKLLFPFTRDGLLALRIVSSFASVASFALLAWLLRRLVGPYLALAGASLYGFLPGVWFHAPRGFSTTPAIALALLAMFYWIRRPGDRRDHWIGWALLGAAATVRPQLAPTLLVLGAFGIYQARGRLRDALGGIAIAAAVVAVAAIVVILDSGGIEGVLQSSRSHLLTSLRAADVTPPLADFGIVRALGGPWPAGIWCALSLIGIARLVMRHRWLGAWAFTLLLVTAWSILVLHPPTFPRYAVLLICVSLPLVLVAIDVPDRPVDTLAGAAVAAVTVFAAVTTAPAMFAAHRTPLPAIAAIRDLQADPEGDPVVHSSGLFSFVRNEKLHHRLDRKVHPVGHLRGKKSRVRGRFTLITSDRNRLPGATVAHHLYTDFPESAWDLSQRRFQEAHVLEAPVLFPEGARTAVEFNSRDEAYLWLTDDVTIIPQPRAKALALVLDVDRNHGPLEVVFRSGRRKLHRQTLDVGTHVVRVPLDRCHKSCRLRARFSRIPAPNPGPSLSARVYGAWCEGPAHRRLQPFESSPGLPLAALAEGVRFEGIHRPEVFTGERIPGAWTDGRATVEFTAGPGEVELHLAQPPPRDSAIIVRQAGRTHRFEAGSNPSRHRFEVEPVNGVIRIEIEGATHRPSSDHPDSRDHRDLGPILFGVSYEPG